MAGPLTAPSFADLTAPRNFVAAPPAQSPTPAAATARNQIVARTIAENRRFGLQPIESLARLQDALAGRPVRPPSPLTGGYSPSMDTPAPHGFLGYLEGQLDKAAADIKNIPGGIVHLATQDPLKSVGEVGKGIIQTIRHPGRDLLQTGTLGLVGAGAIGGTVERASAVGDVFKGAGATDLTSAIGRLPKADKRAYAVLKDPKTHLPKIDRPTYNRIVSPSPQMLDVIKHAPEVAASRTAVLERLSKLREEGQKPAPAGVGSAVRAVGASKPAQVAKAALKTPLPKTRTLTVPGAEGEAAVTVQRLGSKNAAANLVQRKVIDSFRQRALNKGGGEPVSFVPGFQKATDKLAGQFSAANTVGRELRASRRVIDSLELAPASRLERFGRTTPSAVAKTLTGGRVAGPSIRDKLPGDKLSAAEQKAVQIVASGVTPAEHIASHQTELAQGIGKPADHRVQIALTKAAVPHINSPTPKLVDAIKEARAVIASRQDLLGMTPNEIAHSIGAKASDIEARAKGVESPLQELARLEALDAELARYGEGKHATEVAATQKLLDRVTAAQAGKGSPLSGPEVDALHEQITTHLEDLQTAVETHGAAGATDLLPKTRVFVASPGKAAETLPGGPAQSLLGKFGATASAVAKARPSQVSVVEHAIGEASQMLASLRDAASRIEGARSPYPHLLAQESLLRTRLDQLASGKRGARAKFLADTADARTARIADIDQALTDRGYRAQEEGAFYLPSKSLRDLRQARGPAAKIPSVFGLGPGKTRAQILGHEYTGALQRTGNFRTDATGLAADSYRQAQRWATIERGFNQVYAMARPSREEAGGVFAVPIRADAKIPPELKKLFRTTDRGDLTRGDLAHFDQQSVEDWARTLFPDPGRETGMWIDRRYLGALKGDAKNYPDLLKGLDLVNAPFRASLLYTKLAYALNLLQAIGTNAVQQGVFTPLNLYRALTLGRKLASEDQHAVFSLVGSGLSRSFEAESGLGKATINKAGEFWNTVVDRYPRVASFLHEARREGFNDKTTLQQLLNDPRLRDKLVEITRRANQEAIDYGNLTPFERAIVKRAIFFYPWIRGSTLYSLRFSREHPIQSAIGAQVGGEGYDIAKKAFGRILSYTEGIIPVGGKTINLRSINTPSTPVELGQAAAGLIQGRSPHAGDITQQLGPVGLAANALISGKTSLGRDIPHGQSRLGGAAQELLGLIPPLTLARGVPTSKSTNPSKQSLYPHDFQTRLGSFVAGGAFPRTLNVPAYRAKSEAEYVSTLTPEEKIGHKYGKLVGQATLDAKRLHAEGFLESAELPPQVARGLKFEQSRESAYLAAAKKLGAKVADLNTVQKAAASIDVLKQAGVIDAATATRVLRVISAESDPARRKELLKLAWKRFGDGDWVTAWRTLVNHHPVGR